LLKHPILCRRKTGADIAQLYAYARHSDKGKSYCGFNAGLTALLSEWTLIFQANHTPLNRRVPGSSPGAPTKQGKHLQHFAQNGPFSWEAG
jgi:hypothetical protein